MALTAKRRRFCEEYLVDLNAKQAAIRAGYSPRSAEVEGHRLLRNANVAARLAEAQKIRSERTGITQDRVLTELAKIGFSDIRKAINWRANATAMVEDPDTGEERIVATNEVVLIGSEEIDDDTAAAIAEISQTDKGGLKVKFHDKRGALVDIGRHLGMFVDRHEHTGKDGKPIQTEVAQVTIFELPANGRG